MSDLKPTGTLINVDGVERRVLFTISAIYKLQDKEKKPISEIINECLNSSDDVAETMNWTIGVLEVLSNDEAERTGDKEKLVKPGHFKSFITAKNVYAILALLLVEYGIDLPEPEDDDNPNAKGGQQMK